MPGKEHRKHAARLILFMFENFKGSALAQSNRAHPVNLVWWAGINLENLLFYKNKILALKRWKLGLLLGARNLRKAENLF